jgi:hypothetical protein
MDQQQNEVGYLPVFELRHNILQYFENAYPGFVEHLKSEVDFGELKPAIIYDNRMRPISHPSEITPDRQFVLFEPYLAYLWCLSYAVVTFFRERDGDIDPSTNPKLQTAIETLEYGYSLKKQWSSWPPNLPQPTKEVSPDPNVGEANALLVIATAFVLSHEFAHHYLDHSLDGSTTDESVLKSEEFDADNFAFDTVIAGTDESDLSKYVTIQLAIIVGLGSILLASAIWDGGQEHPDVNHRLFRILERLSSDPDGDAWKWGLLILFMWNVAYNRINTDPYGHGSAKADYQFLEAHLREDQLF